MRFTNGFEAYRIPLPERELRPALRHQEGQRGQGQIPPHGLDGGSLLQRQSNKVSKYPNHGHNRYLNLPSMGVFPKFRNQRHRLDQGKPQ